MNINDQHLKKALQVENNENDDKIINTKIISLSFDLMPVNTIKGKYIWENIEFLSLRGSNLTKVNFLENFPNLFYLDIYNNPIENFSLLQKHGTFGYLSFSPAFDYLEDNISVLNKLNIIFLYVEINNENILNNFIIKNPNILILNDNIIDFSNKIELLKNKTKNIKYSQSNNKLYLIQNTQKEEGIQASNKLMNTYNNDKDEKIKKKLKTITRQINYNNKNIKDIENFFENYNKNMYDLYQKENKDYNLLELNEMSVLEKNKYIFIGNIYQKIYKMGINDEYHYCYIPSEYKESLIQEYPNLLIKKNINLNIFNYMDNIRDKEFILSGLVLRRFKILSNMVCSEAIFMILIKSNIYKNGLNIKKSEDLKKNINILINLEDSLLIMCYHKLYEKFFGKIEESKKTKLQIILELNKTSNKVLEISQHQELLIKKYKKTNDPSLRNKLILNDLVEYLKNLKILNDSSYIIQFFGDYLLYNKLESKLVYDYSEDMQLFNNIKLNIILSSNKKTEKDEPFAQKIFNKIQLKTLLNNKYILKSGIYQNNYEYLPNISIIDKNNKHSQEKNQFNKKLKSELNLNNVIFIVNKKNKNKINPKIMTLVRCKSMQNINKENTNISFQNNVKMRNNNALNLAKKFFKKIPLKKQCSNLLVPYLYKEKSSNSTNSISKHKSIKIFTKTKSMDNISINLDNNCNKSLLKCSVVLKDFSSKSTLRNKNRTQINNMKLSNNNLKLIKNTKVFTPILNSNSSTINNSPIHIKQNNIKNLFKSKITLKEIKSQIVSNKINN